MRLVVSCVVEDLLRARKSKPGFEFSVQKYKFTLFEIPTPRKKNALKCLLTITWNKVHNGLMKATDNRLETGLFVSFYSVVNPFLFAACSVLYCITSMRTGLLLRAGLEK